MTFFSVQLIIGFLFTDYNSSRLYPTLSPAPPPPAIPPERILMWLSMIWNSSPGWGILPDSSFDQSGMSFSEISNAPVDINCVSNALHRKKVIMQAYNLFSNIQLHQDGVGWPKFWKRLMLARTITIMASLSTPTSCANCNLYPPGEKLSPWIASSGYFCCSMPAYCWNTFWYPQE